MAEGGIAAALSHVDERDSWKVHFADTMRGGQYVNNWRMAELHAKSARPRARAGGLGALFDGPRTAASSSATSAAQVSAPGHVGDRTGLEDDPDPARSRNPPRYRCPYGMYRRYLLKDGDRIAGALAYDREKGFVLISSPRGRRL